MNAIQQQQAPGADARSQMREQVREQLRAQLEAQRAQLEAQRAQLEAQSANLAQVSVEQRRDVQTIQVPEPPTTVRVQDGRVIVDDRPVTGPEVIFNGRNGPEQIPPQAVEISIAFFVMIAVIALGVPLIRLIRAIVERRPAAPTAIPSDVAQRLDRIEQAVELVGQEVERISEGQRFTSRLLADLRQSPQLAVPERVAEPRR